MFENIEAAKDMLRTRTSKIIGGYVTECYFLEEYCRLYPDRQYSKGWWGGLERSDSGLLTFFVVKNVLNDLDRRVIDRLQAHGYCWKQLICDNNEWFVKDSTTEMTITEYANLRGLRPRHDPDRIRPLVTDDPRLEECIAEYERRGLLQELATSIYLEDHFLNVYYIISNIDFICETDEGIPVYAEIKFKNEFSRTYADVTRKLVFGIDKFQYDNLFFPFIDSGMTVNNVILYNDIKNERNVSTTVIFDFLREKGYQNLIWKYKTIDPDDHLEEHTSGAGRTDWDGEGAARSVYCVPLKEFRDFGPYSLDTDNQSKFPEGAWGICNICNDKRVIRRKRETGEEFIGCLGFGRHPQRTTS